MLTIVWIRGQINVTEYNVEALESLKHPVYEMTLRDGRISPVGTAEAIQDFMLFNEYTDMFQTNYNPMYDYGAPQYFLPQNCLQENGPSGAVIGSPIIAIVGENNTVQVQAIDYLSNIIKWQYNRGLREVNFTFEYYETQDALDDYIGSKNYLRNETNPGVCFGFSFVKENDSAYKAKLFFNDQNHFEQHGVGIPPQLNDAYYSYTKEPRVKDFELYQLNGYNMLQNLFANVVLKD